MVKVNKYHKPLLLVSWSRLIETDISGIRSRILKIKFNPIKDKLSKKVKDKNSKTRNNCQCQNSALEDLPSKSKYL